MGGRPKVDKSRVFMLRAQGWTLDAIAKEFGVTKPAISQCLSRVTRRTNKVRDERPCLCGCGRPVIEPNKYASTACYIACVSGDPGLYVRWRGGNKIARRVVSPLFDLQPQHVVHHVDRNNRNNDILNLWVFASHADHMSHHRGGIAQPIWRGDRDGR